jgi:hypothetical protein
VDGRESLEAVLGFVPAEEGEEPGEGCAKGGVLEGAGKLVPSGAVVEDGLDDHVEEGVGEEKYEPETPGWFVVHLPGLVTIVEELGVV